MTPEGLASLLDLVESQTILAAIQLLHRGAKVPPAAFGVAEDAAGKPVLAMIPILDLAQRFRALRQAVSEANALGFVFYFDGVIKGLDGQHDALLVVTCTRLTARAKAVYYRRTVEGLVIGEPVDAPDAIAVPYQQVFDVQPSPDAAPA